MAIQTQQIWDRRATWGLGAIAVLAAGFRVWQLSSVPPGVSGGEATIGLAAQALLHHGTIPGMNAADGYAPLWVVLQALPQLVLGHTELALRIMPLIIGILAVAATWLWAKDWFGTRVAWIAGLLMAVTPWAVTLSRSAGPAVLATLLLPLSLWLAGRALSRDSVKYWWLVASLVVVSLLCGPLGLMNAIILVVYGGFAAWRNHVKLFNPRHLGSVIVASAGVLGLVVLVAVKYKHWHDVMTSAGMTGKLADHIATFGKVAAMFNLHGDDSFLHNFGGQPMLNAFVGLMFVAGLLVSITRFGKRRHQAVVAVFVLALVPAIITTTAAPNSARAALALPVALVLAAIGTAYMLELWHTTFPINSAARSTGLAAVLLLLGLSVFQGYVQVFTAWAGSAETYVAYNEGATTLGHQINTKTKPANYIAGRYLVATPSEQSTVAYLTGAQGYVPITSDGIITLPEVAGARQFLITAAVRDQAAHNLSLKAPGGKLVPSYSNFSQNELYYTYEIAK